MLASSIKGETMAQYRLKQKTIEASQWLMNGSHPNDDCTNFCNGVAVSRTEGKVVKEYRLHIARNGYAVYVHGREFISHSIYKNDYCSVCGNQLLVHGWISTSDKEGRLVCPKDWIITGTDGEYYPIKNDVFKEMIEKEGENK